VEGVDTGFYSVHSESSEGGFKEEGWRAASTLAGGSSAPREEDCFLGRPRRWATRWRQGPHVESTQGRWACP